jgi:hypothetical protein
MTGWLTVVPFAAMLACWAVLMLVTLAPSNVKRPDTRRDALIRFARAVHELERALGEALAPAVARTAASMRRLTESFRRAEKAARRAGGPPPPR